MKNTQTQGYIQVFTAGFLWGTVGIWATLLGRMGMDSMNTAFFRLLSATVILFIVLVIKGKGFSLFRISKRGLISCILIGFISQGFYNFFYMYSVQNSGMSTAAVLLYTAPIFVAVLSRIFLKEEITGNKIIAIVINILGCILTVTGGSLASAMISSKGIIFGVLAGLTYALMPILGRIGADEENPFTTAFYGLAFAGLLLFFMARPLNGIDFDFTPQAILVIIAYGLIPSALGYIIYFAGLGKITETSIVPIFTSVENVAAAAFGFLIFHESFTPVKVIGVLLVFVSIIVMNIRKEKQTP